MLKAQGTWSRLCSDSRRQPPAVRLCLAASPAPTRSRCAAVPVDRHRRNGRRLLPVRRRPREGPQREPSWRSGHGRGDRCVGRQPQADSRRPRRHRVHARRHAGRRRRGRGAFEGRPVPAASLAVLYSNYTHLVTSADSGILSVADLRGKTVSTGSPGSGTRSSRCGCSGQPGSIRIAT